MAVKLAFMQNGFNIKEIDMKIVKDIFDRVFSFTGMVGLLVLLTGWFLGSAIINENEERALNKACYDGGLIKVDTDAGSYCVAPANLVRVEVK
jgi:hypothetical protein